MNSPPDRIAVFLPSLRGGGAERVMLNLALGFCEQGVETDMVLAQAEGPYLDELPAEISVVDLKAPRIRNAVRPLMAYLKQQQPTGLLSSMAHANMMAVLAKQLSRSPTRVVATLHNTLSQKMPAQNFFWRHFGPSLMRQFYMRADAVVAVSHGVANDACQVTGFPEKRMQVIYNPVITDELYRRADEAIDHPWFEPGQPPVLISVGRLNRQKDYGLLIRSFALIREKMPARLLILGEGEERATLESLIAELDLNDSIALPGFVANPYALMKRAAAFVLSSGWEGLPTVLIEALALGVPLVSTDCPSGPHEILKGGSLGKLVPVGDAAALAGAVLDVLNGDFAADKDLDLARFERDQAVSSYLHLLRGK